LATLTFLGTSAAVPAIGHDNTYFAVEGEQSTLLIDCAGSPLQKLQLAGIEPCDLRYLIITHRHPDHLYGFPILMLGLWLLHQKAPLQVIGEEQGILTAKGLLDLFRHQEWPGFVWPRFQQVYPGNELVLLDLPDLFVSACATKHVIPSMAVKLMSKASGRTVVYSSDTEPCMSLVRMAQGVDVLIHEASGEMAGHSSASQAGQVAAQAEVGQLYLVHYPAPEANLNDLVADARKEFPGQVQLARDFGAIEF
jgi:ribonuclease Z